MRQQHCSGCKNPITGTPIKYGGGVLCDNCYPFIREGNGRLRRKGYIVSNRLVSASILALTSIIPRGRKTIHSIL